MLRVRRERAEGCRKLPEFAMARMTICEACDHCTGGSCKLLIKRDGRLATGNVEAEAVRPEGECPEWKWKKLRLVSALGNGRYRCQWCDRIHDSPEDVCHWCKHRLQSDKKNLSRNVGRVQVVVPADSRFHEVFPFHFTGPPVRHLHYFCFPRHLKSVEYHIEQLKRSLHLFNGTKVCCVAFDQNTCHEAAAKELSEIFDVVYYKENEPHRREAIGFVQSLEEIKESTVIDENHMICFAHAKGQQSHTCHSELIRKWCDAMYETCMRNVDEVEFAFKEGYPIAGSFKSVGAFRSTPYKWHYSGSFWWARAESLFANREWRRICRKWWATESYVGKHFAIHEGYCLFGMDTCGGGLYSEATWKVVDKELLKWRESRVGNKACRV